MTAVTDTRKRSRDEDTCDFVPISKRINNLTLTSQSLGEQETASAQLNGNGALNHFMAINGHTVQSQPYAQQPPVMHSYANNMSHHQYFNHGHIQPHQLQHHPQQQQQQHQDFHQSHIVQSTNHSNGFQQHNGSHLALGTKPNQQLHHHHQHQHMHQPQSHHQTHPIEANNNNNDETYCPELTADENPFYYDKNKLLFDLHVERQRRHQNNH